MAWAALLGTAYVLCVGLGASFKAALAAVGTCYLALSAAALGIIGVDAQGALAAAGMLVPALTAAVLALISSRG